MKKQILTLITVLISISSFAQFQDTACKELDVDHAIFNLQHDFYQQLNNLNQIGLVIQSANKSLPKYNEEMMNIFMEQQPYYKLLEIAGQNGELSCQSILTIPIDFTELNDYAELINKLRSLSPEMEAFESIPSKKKTEDDRLLKFKAGGDKIEWRISFKYVAFDGEFIRVFQETVTEYTDSEKGQLCWFLSMDEEHLAFMWLTPQQMLYMNETLHLHRINYNGNYEWE